MKLRQNYNREAPRLESQIGRYAHAKQYKRMKKVRISVMVIRGFRLNVIGPFGRR
ncbi:MAG: Mobile element protein [uncultured Paraburkholderia sp.]|nr:MAG: Mobile element protein [uncultured Paraburkholderia sp.]CAH2946005.1 MAG: Mobile element protein [uncultured Paraburkholderia sp.]